MIAIVEIEIKKMKTMHVKNPVIGRSFEGAEGLQ
jgi:hypothetical protein